MYICKQKYGPEMVENGLINDASSVGMDIYLRVRGGNSIYFKFRRTLLIRLSKKKKGFA